MKTLAAVLLAATCALALPSSEAKASVAPGSGFSISFMGINLSFGVRRYYAPRRHYASHTRSARRSSSPRQETRSVQRNNDSSNDDLRPSRLTVPAS